MQTRYVLSAGTVALAALTLATASEASVVSANLPAVDVNGEASGYFSDAYSSNGSYYNEQSIAVRITVGASYNINQLTFWGFSENFFQAGLANVAGFQMQIISADFNTVAVDHAWSLDELAVQATGNSGVTGGTEYQFTGELNHILSAGTYWLNIGVVAVDGDGDGWIWTNGMVPTNPLGVAFGNGSGWDPWSSFPDTSGSGSHILFGTVIPGPGALALLAMGVLPRSRRRH